MLWGFAGPWYGEFMFVDGAYIKDPKEQRRQRLRFLVKHGLSCTGMGLDELAALDQVERDAICAYLGEHDLHLTLGFHYRYLEADAEEIKRRTEQIVAALHRFVPQVRAPIVTTGPCAGHRFDRVMPLEAKLERISRCLAPIAEACAELAIPLGIENHGDYYCSDLVKLCSHTPHLSIFLDTGNTYLIGERPLPAFQAAAPFVVGGHFKDHWVRPNHEKLSFDLDGAPLGEGDVPLRECFDLLMEQASRPDKLVIEIEMICPRDRRVSPEECLERSVRFVKGLEAGRSGVGRRESGQ